MGIQHPPPLQPRKTPRQARSAVTVEAIFKATIQVLLADGATRLTTTRVAERAGVSVGTLYQYFPHKQALLYALVRQHLEAFAQEFEAACLQLRQQPMAALTQGLVQAFLAIKVREPEETRALYKIASELDTEELRIGTARRLQQACAGLLESAPDAQFDAVSDVSFTLLTAMNGTTRAVFESGAQPRRVKMLREQLLVLCRAYLAASARR